MEIDTTALGNRVQSRDVHTIRSSSKIHGDWPGSLVIRYYYSIDV